MLTHRALAANIEQVAAIEPPMIHGDDVVLGVLPLFHVYGLNGVLGGVLRHRAKLVLADGFDPEGTLDLVDDEAVSVLPVAPPVFAHWRDVDLDGRLGPVRLVLCGSAPLDPEVAAEFTARTGIAVHQGYGLTEAAPVVTSTLRSDEPGRRARSAARSTASRSGSSTRTARWSRATTRARSASAAPTCSPATGPTAPSGPDADGWWATGDVGFLDRRGDVFLVDRVRELVIVSGFNVYPVEVEDVVREVTGVTEAAVIGVADDPTGEAVVAFVVAPTAARPTTLAAAVREHCEQPAGAVQGARPASRWSTRCRTASPARCRRAGCAPGSGAGCSGSSSERE